MLSQSIDLYLEDHKTAWAPSTLRSETARLRAIRAVIDQGPSSLHEHCLAKGQKPYAVKTLFIRVCCLEAWVGQGTEYREWFKKHANRFKHAYVKKEVELSYDEAVRHIQAMPEPYRTQALQMLKTGVRISEVATAKDGMVIGKGARPRKIFGTIELSAPQSTFRAKLKAVGLSPHMLRKLCATKLASKGATPADLCAVFGWSSIQTAFYYLQSQAPSRLQSLMDGEVDINKT
jgi:integrase